MHPKDAEGIANSVDPDQTAPLGAVWSRSALFAQTCLSENLGTLRYASPIFGLMLHCLQIPISTFTVCISVCQN